MPRQEGVRVLRDRGVCGEREVVPEERRPVREAAGAQDRGCGRVRHRLVASRELEEHDFAGRLKGLTRCGAYATGLPACDAHSVRSSSSWIADAPGTVSTSGGRFRSGMFSSNVNEPGRL